MDELVAIEGQDDDQYHKLNIFVLRDGTEQRMLSCLRQAPYETMTEERMRNRGFMKCPRCYPEAYKG